jgi:hypothetical protein
MDMVEGLAARRFYPDLSVYQALSDTKVPMMAYGGAFRMGRPWIKVEEFTPKVAAVLALGRPQAMMGGEIKVYQQEHVPRYLFHLRRYMPEVWAGVLEIVPELENRLPNLDSVRDKGISIHKVPAGTTITLTKQPKGDHVDVEWDGTRLTLTGGSSLTPLFLLWDIPKNTHNTVIFEPQGSFQVIVKDEDVLGQLWESGQLEV